jgi:hypothetical protein
MSGQRWLALYDLAGPFEMRRYHPRNCRHGSINRGALSRFSILEFHP